MAVILYNIY